MIQRGRLGLCRVDMIVVLCNMSNVTRVATFLGDTYQHLHYALARYSLLDSCQEAEGVS